MLTAFTIIPFNLSAEKDSKKKKRNKKKKGEEEEEKLTPEEEAEKKQREVKQIVFLCHRFNPLNAIGGNIHHFSTC